MGEAFLMEIAIKHKFEFLISNSSKEMKIKHKKLIKIKSDDLTLFFIGILDPDLLKSQYKHLFESPQQAIQKQFMHINSEYTKLKKRIILLSHSGLDPDKSIATNNPKIDWIIGAHTQSFLRYSVDISTTKIVQTNNKEMIGIKGFTRANTTIPPTGLFFFIIRVVIAGSMMIATKGMANQDGIGFIRVQFAIGFHHQVILFDHTPAAQFQWLIKMKELRRHDADRICWNAFCHSLKIQS